MKKNLMTVLAGLFLMAGCANNAPVGQSPASPPPAPPSSSNNTNPPQTPPTPPPSSSNTNPPQTPPTPPPSSSNNTNPPQTTPLSALHACTLEYSWGLTLTIKDEEGNFINDATITILESSETDLRGHEFSQKFAPDGTYLGLGEASGFYKLRIEKAGYVSQELSLTLDSDACHVIGQFREITLKKSN